MTDSRVSWQSRCYDRKSKSLVSMEKLTVREALVCQSSCLELKLGGMVVVVGGKGNINLDFLCSSSKYHSGFSKNMLAGTGFAHARGKQMSFWKWLARHLTSQLIIIQRSFKLYSRFWDASCHRRLTNYNKQACFLMENYHLIFIR